MGDDEIDGGDFQLRAWITNDEEPESGRRLQGSFDFVCELLRKVSMDLIIKVEMGRRLRHSRYHRRAVMNSDEFGYIQPSARQDSSSPGPTVRSVRSEPVRQPGKRIVDELGTD